MITALNVQVKDQVTGLIWQRNKASTYLLWDSSASTGSAQWYCQNLVIGNHGAGSWQLPTIKELASIVDYSADAPAINLTAFPGTGANAYWSSTPYTKSPGNALYVYFHHGAIAVISKFYNTSNVRCVLNSSATLNNGMWSVLAYQDVSNQISRYYISSTTPNAIVTDDFTGLMWEQQISSSTYFWNTSAPAGSAQAYCKGLSKGGYKDWQLPTVSELQSLMSYTPSAFATIDGTAFPGTIPLSVFWTSDSYVGSAANAWTLYFGYYGLGDSAYYTTNSAYNVRCVRKNNTVPSTRYTDENGNVLTSLSIQVQDQVTGLIWQRTFSSSPLLWDPLFVDGSAQSYCQNLVIGNQGAGSWYLPTVKELITIVDYTIYSPSINITAFPGTPATAFWVNSQYGASTNVGYRINFNTGDINSPYYPGYYYYVRCILNTSVPANNGMWSRIAYQDATNQTARYYVSGATPNATVTDDFTGLMWEQQVSTSTYFWNASAPAGSAQAYCASLNKGGYTDWRLPTPLELQSLIDYTIAGPGLTINVAAFSGTPASHFWTSVLSVASTNAWYGRFDDGEVISEMISVADKVRCVRGSNMASTARFTDETGMALTNLRIQVKDQTTAVIWQRAQASSPMTGNSSMVTGSAQQYCQNLVIGTQGAGSWQLPTVKALTTLVSYLVKSPSINTTAFPNTQNASYWSSSKAFMFGLPVYAWDVNFNSGVVTYDNIIIDFSVRCILNTSAPANNGRWSILAYQDATTQTARYYVFGPSPNSIVTDDFTGLMWEQQVSTSTYF